MKAYLVSHLPKQEGVRRAKSSNGMIGQATVQASTETQARAIFRELFPHREPVATGELGVVDA